MLDYSFCIESQIDNLVITSYLVVKLKISNTFKRKNEDQEIKIVSEDMVIVK